ncbi:MAG: HYR domain-containing protein, partial [Saprospiraceae bacterium]
MNRFIAFAFFICLAVVANGSALASHRIIPPIVPSVVLTDTVPPLINCPPNDTILLPSGACDTVVTYVVTAFDDTVAIVPTQWSGLASGEPFPTGATMNVFVASDSVGNTADCSFTILVLTDSSALMCRDTFKAYLGEFCLVVPQPSELLIGAFGCSLNLLVEADKEVPYGNGPWSAAFFEETDLGKTYAYRVTDLLGSRTCTGAVRVLDSLPPVLICPEVLVPCVLPPEHLNPYFLSDSLFVWEALPQFSENCANDIDLNFVDVRTDYPCDSIDKAGVITRFWTALDASNNVSTCVQTIVRERSADAVSFPLDGTWGCSPPPLPGVTGWPFIDLNGRQYPVTDTTACGIAVRYTESDQIYCGANRLINRLWRITNGCLPDSVAIPSIGEQIVEVLEDTEPTLLCPLDSVVVINGPGCEGSVDLPDILVADACSQVLSTAAYWTMNGHEDSLVAVLSDFPGNNFSNPDTLAVFGQAPDFPAGNISIFLVASDACGNTGTCEINLIVQDSAPPEARCDTFLTAFLDDLGLATLPAGLFDEGSTDECAQITFKVRRIEAGTCDTLGNALGDFINLCCADRGDTILVQLRVYDVPMEPGSVPDSLAMGRYSECTAPVLVLDINNPRCTAPPDTVTTCDSFDPTLVAYGTASITCVVDSVAVLTNYIQFDTVCQRGTITRTFRVFDAAGTSAHCAHKIVVQNAQHYYVRFPDDLSVVQCDTAGNSYGQPVFFGDKCEKMTVSFTETAQYGAPDACIRIERTWKVYNGCAFDSTMSFVAVPNPNPNAVPTHAENLPGPVVSEAGTTGPWAPTVSKIAPNSPQPTNFNTYWSATVNGYTYKQIIRVIDLEMPV